MASVTLDAGTKAAVLIQFGDRNGTKQPDAGVTLFEVRADGTVKERFDTGPVDLPLDLVEKAAMMAVSLAPHPVAQVVLRVAIKVFFSTLRAILT